MVDLHRHDMFSNFDGFGRPQELVELAVKLGHSSFSTSNHGNTNGLIQTYMACKKNNIKAILGVEGYFLPKVKEEKQRGFHLCLFAKNLKGYGNLNRIQTEGEKQKYYNSIWDFKLLNKHSEGLICTSGCVGGYLGKAISKGNLEQAEKFLKKMVEIFGDDFYIEIQPYKVDESATQEEVNYHSMVLARKLNIKTILTSDSHYTVPDDFNTYLKMHEINNNDLEKIEKTYKERYMPTEKDLVDRFVKMHGKGCEFKKFYFKGGTDLKKGCYDYAKQMIKNLEEIEKKVELNYLDQLEAKLPKLTDVDSKKVLTENVKKGLKKRGKLTKEYIDRCKEELEVINYHGFEDYFLMVQDYTNWAREKGIVISAGRGSVCNSLVAYALYITDTDSLLHELDFKRFLRKDKSKFPDIDLDFQGSRRGEVIDYLCNKYPGQSAMIASYGLYKVDNLINDLAKVCGLSTDKTVDSEQVKFNKRIILDLKKICNDYIDEDGNLNYKYLQKDVRFQQYNEEYDDILEHFSKMFKKVRHMGTHAAGVAITGNKLLDYSSLINKKDKWYTSYDLADLEEINMFKFDILGLKTMDSISDLQKVTGVVANHDEIINDKELLEEFRLGNTDGIFQLEKKTAKKLLDMVGTNSFNDIIAVNAMNRPGPLKQKMPEQYAENKLNLDKVKFEKYYEFCKDSYGTIIYQEQLQQICINIAGMSWAQADKVMKMMKNGEGEARIFLKELKEKTGEDLQKIFIDGAVKSGYSESEAEELFNVLLVYSFNKGHATGYSLISIEEMFYKKNYPTEFWWVKMKYAKDDAERDRYSIQASADDIVQMLPHVNYSAETTLRVMEGESVIQLGLNTLKGIGEKAAVVIEEERQKRPFISYDDFYDRCKGRAVTTKVISILKEWGALEFNKKTYIGRVVKFNSSLLAKNLQ